MKGNYLKAYRSIASLKPGLQLKNKREIHQLAYQYYLTIVSERPADENIVQSLLEAHYHACKAEKYDEAANIIFDTELYEYLDTRGNYRTLVELYEGVYCQKIHCERKLESI
jgi:hypothetical protein